MRPVAHDRIRFDDGACTNAASVDHAPGPITTSSSMIRSLLGSRCRTAFARMCTRSPMRTGHVSLQ